MPLTKKENKKRQSDISKYLNSIDFDDTIGDKKLQDLKKYETFIESKIRNKKGNTKYYLLLILLIIPISLLIYTYIYSGRITWKYIITDPLNLFIVVCFFFFTLIEIVINYSDI